MKIRIAWKNKVVFAELESGHQSYVEGSKLEELLTETFRRVRVDIMQTADSEDEVPKTVFVEIDVQCIEDDGSVRKDHTPRGLFELMPQEKRDEVKKTRKKGGANNGHR